MKNSYCVSVLIVGLISSVAPAQVATLTFQGTVTELYAENGAGQADVQAFRQIIPFDEGADVAAIVRFRTGDIGPGTLATNIPGLFRVEIGETRFEDATNIIRFSLNSSDNPTVANFSPNPRTFPAGWSSTLLNGSVGFAIVLRDDSGEQFEGLQFDPTRPLDETDFTGASYTFFERNKVHTWTTPLGAHTGTEHRIDVVFQTLQVEVIPLLIGDVNLDFEVNLLDIGPFIDLITSGGFLVEADINQDKLVNLLDVAPFVNLLSGN